MVTLELFQHAVSDAPKRHFIGSFIAYELQLGLGLGELIGE